MSLEPTAGVLCDDKVHRLPVRVYYEDTDFSGVVYHARYLGIHHSELAQADDPLAFAVRRMSIEFAVAARVDDALVVETLFRPQKGSRLMIEQRLMRGETLIASADVQAVCISLDGAVKRPPRSMAAKWQNMVIPVDS